MINGFIRVGAVVPKLKVADIDYNIAEIKNAVKSICKKGVKIVLFPELCLTGYTCQDMFLQSEIKAQSLKAIKDLLDFSKGIESVLIVGSILEVQNKLFNVAIVIYNGEISGVVPKTYIPNYNEFYEKRYFSSALDTEIKSVEMFGKNVPFGRDIIFKINNEIKFGIEICEDLWSVKQPSQELSLCGANLIFNLSASNEIIGKYEYRKELVKMQSSKTISAYIYSSSGVNESTTDLLFSGHSLICENGTVLKENKRFDFETIYIYADIDYEFLNSERISVKSFSYGYPKIDFREVKIDITINGYDIEREYKKLPFVPSENNLQSRCDEIMNILAYALCKKVKSANTKHLVIGVSGGLDSTLALLVIERAMKIMNLPPENVIAVTMPGFGTKKKKKTNAANLIKLFKMTYKNIDIKNACEQHFKDIGLTDYNSLCFENAQARERTQILFDIANMYNALVIGTGDLSELALGWCTYNGDHMSSYALNSSIPKTLIKYLVQGYVKTNTNKEINDVLLDIINTPISPELALSNGKEIVQKTEELIGDYELNDFFLYHFLRRKSSAKKIAYLAHITFGLDMVTIKEELTSFFKRFFANQFKRSCLPDGVKVGTVSVSPRGDLRMSSDTSLSAFLNDLL